MTTRKNSDTYKSISEALTSIQSEIKASQPHAIKTGLGIIDRCMDGFYPGEVCIIGARPAMGKTIFILSLISRMVNAGVPVGLLTAVDKPDVNLFARVVSAIRNSIVPDSYEERLHLIQEASLDEIPLYLKYEPRMSIHSLRENATRLVEERGVKCLFVEKIQSLFDYVNSSTEGSTQTVCQELRILAQELNIPIVVTADLSRNPEHREGPKYGWPQLSDLQNSSAIEYNADKVLLLYRPECYSIYQSESGYDLKNVLSVIIAKNKYGITNDFDLRFDPSRCRIVDFDEYVNDKKEVESEIYNPLGPDEGIQNFSDLPGTGKDFSSNFPF